MGKTPQMFNVDFYCGFLSKLKDLYVGFELNYQKHPNLARQHFI